MTYFFIPLKKDRILSNIIEKIKSYSPQDSADVGLLRNQLTLSSLSVLDAVWHRSWPCLFVRQAYWVKFTNHE